MYTKRAGEGGDSCARDDSCAEGASSSAGEARTPRSSRRRSRTKTRSRRARVGRGEVLLAVLLVVRRVGGVRARAVVVAPGRRAARGGRAEGAGEGGVLRGGRAGGAAGAPGGGRGDGGRRRDASRGVISPRRGVAADLRERLAQRARLRLALGERLAPRVRGVAQFAEASRAALELALGGAQGLLEAVAAATLGRDLLAQRRDEGDVLRRDPRGRARGRARGGRGRGGGEAERGGALGGAPRADSVFSTAERVSGAEGALGRTKGGAPASRSEHAAPPRAFAMVAIRGRARGGRVRGAEAKEALRGEAQKKKKKTRSVKAAVARSSRPRFAGLDATGAVRARRGLRVERV